jgi:hypothetical protein
MRRIASLGLVFLSLTGVALSAEETATELRQPTQSRSLLVLESAMGEARVERQGGGSQRIAVRKNELLTTIAETRSGWTAAGIKQVRHGTELVVISRGTSGTRRLPTPEVQRHDLRLRPTLLVDDENMDGLAWLEGTDITSLSVRTAQRTGEEWSDVNVVAAPARGSQTGLVATALADGSWLLAWSAFDGNDDDILWSRGRGGQWSSARRVTQNDTLPDVTPTLIATGNGALLSWSRLINGEYQVVLARFDGTNWSPPSALGPRGSLDPRFVLRDDTLHLIFRNAWPAGWTVADVAATGRMQRIAILAGKQASSPVLMRSVGDSVELQWPHQASKTQRWEAVP